MRNLFTLLNTIRPEPGQGPGLQWREGVLEKCLGEQVKIQIPRSCQRPRSSRSKAPKNLKILQVPPCGGCC